MTEPSKTKLLHLLPERRPRNAEKLRRLSDLATCSLQCSRDLRPLGRIPHFGQRSQSGIASPFGKQVRCEYKIASRRLHSAQQSGPQFAPVPGPVMRTDGLFCGCGNPGQRLGPTGVQSGEETARKPDGIVRSLG